MDTLSAAGLVQWTPVRVTVNGPEPMVEWAIFDGPPLEPFFEQSASRAMTRPFNLVFARRTPLAALNALEVDGALPTGLVFHMSRCGSTLVAQMLSRLSSSVVLSEAQPVDAIVQLYRTGRLDTGAAVRLLRAVVGAMGRPLCAERLFLKLHAWHVLELPLFAAAFPRVPWSFVFRDPDAVLRSQLRAAGAELAPELVRPASFGISRNDALEMSREDYVAAVLAALCEAALAGAESIGPALFLDYAGLPDAVFERLLPFFGVSANRDDAERMRERAAFDTKRQGSRFDPNELRTANGRADERVAPARLRDAFARLTARAAGAR